MAKDMLFATLDTTTRRIELPDGQPLLLTDTVGFVRNLPHRLVEAFKATLEEAVLADFLIHVMDATSPELDIHFETTRALMKELGADEKRVVQALNKIDLVEGEGALADLASRYPEAVMISAASGLGMERLTEQCAHMLADRVRRLSFRIPQARADAVGLLHQEGKVLSVDYDGNDVLVTAVAPPAVVGRLTQFIDAGNRGVLQDE
jgi:GTP-binding protein HflX